MSHLDDSDRRSRQAQLLDLLRHLASRIQDLDQDDRLLDASAELQRLLGTAHLELFHHDARAADTASSDAEHRRIVEEARRAPLSFDQPGDDQPWRRPQAE
jgi:hypothetical protein